MNTSIVLESNRDAVGRFRTAVSLHSHTLHSREALNFVYKLAKCAAPLRIALARGEARYRAVHGHQMDLNRAWWTPPAAPRDAWMLEKRHIENRFGRNPLVSLTDHDDIEAPMTLRVLDECRDLPVSVEWTVPFEETFFHIGVHNLHAASARRTMADLAAFTAAPAPGNLAPIFESLAARPETLIVLNHPHWDENGIGQARHEEIAGRFARRYGEFLHAFELNGLRPWKENRGAIRLAEACAKPVISGGDRHAMEPNAVLNLTNAGTFSEFAAEVRSGWSDVLITNQYREPFALRILQSVEEVLQEYQNHGRGWRHWSDRVFYLGDDGVTRSMREMFHERWPAPVRLFVRAVELVRRRHLRQAVRFAFPKEEPAL
jgi:hypothetical protein